MIAAAAGLALAATSGTASAWEKPCFGCGHGLFGLGHGGRPVPPPSTLFQGGGLSHKKLPAFQAAPWYLYWPYDAHFLTPAPVSGPFYGPPLTGNFPVNPYFPGPAGAVGFGAAGFGFGQGIPGGAPPVPPVQPVPAVPVAPPGR
jgi:hypothetical protein